MFVSLYRNYRVWARSPDLLGAPGCMKPLGGALRLKDVYQLRGCWRSKSGHFFTEEKSHPHYFCVYWEVVLLLVTEQTWPTGRRSDVFLVSLDVVQFSCIIMG